MLAERKDLGQLRAAKPVPVPGLRIHRLALAPNRRYRPTMNEELDKILVTTMNDVPGYEIVAVYGEVFGLIVRARNVFSNFGASLRTVFGGEVGGYTKLLSESRSHAIERLRLAAQEKGGNAVIAMRFDCNEIANLMSEIAAYGTAVTVRKK
jgi:uncharacterized protein YbjQ (UPF0145 family)